MRALLRPPDRPLRLLTRFAALMCLLAALASGQGAHAASIAIVLSEPSQVYQEFAEAFRRELRREGASHEVQVFDSDQLGTRALPDSQLVVAVGSRAAQQIAGRDLKVPIIAALLPKATFDRLLAARPPENRRLTAVFVDQPPNRYVDLVRVALPDVDRVGFLVGKDSRDTVARLVQSARERKLRPLQETIGNEFDIVPALQRMFSDGGVLLATPDGSIFNNSTVPNILLSAYRLRVPLVAFSPSYVRSGAMLGIYSTPAQIGQQSAEAARSTLAGNALPAPAHPRLFSVGVNTHVARSLGYQIDSEAVIQEKLERLERGQ